MYNAQQLQDICNLDCSRDEISRFCAKARKQKVRQNNSFDKYYDLNTILLALIKFEQGEVGELDMLYWAEAYHHLIADGVKVEHGQRVTLRQYVKQIIVDSVYDLVNYFDNYDKQYSVSINSYKLRFCVLDYVLRDVDNCKAMFSRQNARDRFPIALIVNDDKEYYIEQLYYFGDWDPDVSENRTEFNEISMRNAKKRLARMRQLGYTDLHLIM